MKAGEKREREAMTKETLRAYLPMKQELAQIRELLLETEAGKALGCPDEDGDILALYKQKAAALQARLLAIESAIDTLPPPGRIILRRHFIQGMTWRQVGEIEHYSERHLTRLCNKVLKQLKEY